MKTKITYLFALTVALALSVVKADAQKKLIDYWSFNCTNPVGGSGGINLTPIQPDYEKGTGASLVYNQVTTPLRDSIIDNGNGGSTINVRAGYGSCTDTANLYVRTRNPSSEGQFLWYMPTKGFQNVIITYATERSNNGPQTQNYSYSIDSGKTFITTGLPMLTNTVTTTWDSISINLSTVSAVNNTNRFVFRITYSINDSVGSGNDRYDNVTLEGDSIPSGINELTNAGNSYTLFPNPANNTVCVNGSYTGNKVITVYSILGQQVLTAKEEQKPNFNLNVSGLNSGIYFINVREELSGNSYVIKFVKN